MDFFLIPQPTATLPVRYQDLAREVARQDGRILSHADAGKLCKLLQGRAFDITKELNARRRALLGRPTEWHPDFAYPKVELRPRDNHLALVIEGNLLAILRLVNGNGLLTPSDGQINPESNATDNPRRPRGLGAT